MSECPHQPLVDADGEAVELRVEMLSHRDYYGGPMFAILSVCLSCGVPYMSSDQRERWRKHTAVRWR